MVDIGPIWSNLAMQIEFGQKWTFWFKTTFFAKNRLPYAQNMNTSTKKLLFLDKSWHKLVEFGRILGYFRSKKSNSNEFEQIRPCLVPGTFFWVTKSDVLLLQY
jgi:hypothetical protein